MLHNGITKPLLRKLVISFYTKVLKDDLVGPIFIRKLGDDLSGPIWGPHLDTITNFWASISLGERDYNSSPYAPHMKLKGLSRDAFNRWLELFSQTLDSIFIPAIADKFKERSTLIAGNFMRNLGL
ncbi:group III truncated hemoglobin [Sulfurimonas sp. MAG313]|nr:group III truncated hemoglobin [Sulfurimonas sp. MAG313]MDF1879924.1 group III truncated hemoglobin [Sulfurimonas sp. MAG313]